MRGVSVVNGAGNKTMRGVSVVNGAGNRLQTVCHYGARNNASKTGCGCDYSKLSTSC